MYCVQRVHEKGLFIELGQPEDSVARMLSSDKVKHVSSVRVCALKQPTYTI
jgi:hypothetical protein